MYMIIYSSSYEQSGSAAILGLGAKNNQTKPKPMRFLLIIMLGHGTGLFDSAINANGDTCRICVS